jgi:hypothetical protein
VADWLLHLVMSLSLVAPNLWIHYPPASFVTIPIIVTVSPTLSSLFSLFHSPSPSQSPKFIHCPWDWKRMGLLIQTSPPPKFIHFPCRLKNGWVYPSKNLHLQSSSIFPVVSKMGGFSHPNISISKIHPFSLQFPKWVGLSIRTPPSPKFIHFPCSFQNGWV